MGYSLEHISIQRKHFNYINTSKINKKIDWIMGDFYIGDIKYRVPQKERMFFK